MKEIGLIVVLSAGLFCALFGVLGPWYVMVFGFLLLAGLFFYTGFIQTERSWRSNSQAGCVVMLFLALGLVVAHFSKPPASWKLPPPGFTTAWRYQYGLDPHTFLLTVIGGLALWAVIGVVHYRQYGSSGPYSRLDFLMFCTMVFDGCLALYWFWQTLHSPMVVNQAPLSHRYILTGLLSIALPAFGLYALVISRMHFIRFAFAYLIYKGLSTLTRFCVLLAWPTTLSSFVGAATSRLSWDIVTIGIFLIFLKKNDIRRF